VARIMVMMSGGVDSSVAAALLRDEGHDVTGVTLKLWGGASDSGCCSVSDVEDARRVADQLDLPHYVFNFSEDFDTHVVQPYVAAYDAARTPNPCVECNRSLKFGRALERAEALGFDAVATGHHARVARDADGTYALQRGLDPDKDQSYVLYMLGQHELAHTRLPIGAMTKSEVRERATALGLRTAAKAESMDVCFITRGNRESFIHERVAPRGGEIVATDGALLGSHAGVANFTIGQRRGIGVATGERRYVLDVDATTARVTIGRREDLVRSAVDLDGLTFATVAPGANEIVHAQTRAHGEAPAARLVNGTLHWCEPQPRVAPGQVVALYRGDLVVGGGIAQA
jgi:tRNA-specific 2-thiouridylase